MAHAKADSTYWSPEQMLEDALAQVRRGERRGRKAVVIFLDESDDSYNVGWTQAGMKCSEMVGLAEVFKVDVLNEMGYVRARRED